MFGGLHCNENLTVHRCFSDFYHLACLRQCLKHGVYDTFLDLSLLPPTAVKIALPLFKLKG